MVSPSNKTQSLQEDENNQRPMAFGKVLPFEVAGFQR